MNDAVFSLAGLPELIDAWEPAGHAEPDLISPVVTFGPYAAGRRPLACVATGSDWATLCGTNAGYEGELPIVPDEFDGCDSLRYAFLVGWSIGDGYRSDRAEFERDRDHYEDMAAEVEFKHAAY